MSTSSDLERIFHQARGITAGPDRDAYLDEACGSNQDLRGQVLGLLGADADAEDVFVEPATSRAGDETPGALIGRYKLLQQIGEGGFGVVWMAEQQEPVVRKVALKIIKLGMDTNQVVARFEAERQALALMDHPNIAKVLDGGSTASGRPYFVMELIKGVPITDYCDAARLAPDDRLELFQSVCQAIQHAHQKGIIHRDIKPNNVMVTLHDGEPVVKVIDFGIAKATEQRLTEKTMFTKFEQMIGTPEYMSPEQAELSGLDIDTRSDIYSLGVLLYELLTGTKPFDARSLLEQGYAEMMRVIREVDPDKPSTRLSTNQDGALDVARKRHMQPESLSRFVRGELDWIVMKCLDKDRGRRYDTANGLALDIRRYLDDEPVLAGAPTAAYRLRKLVRRNRGKVAAGATVLGALVLGATGTTLGWIGAVQAGERANRELSRATIVKGIISDMLTSVSPEQLQWRGYDTELLKEILRGTEVHLEGIEDELVLAEMHDLIGRTYRDLFDNTEARRNLELAHGIRGRLLGEDAEETLGTKLVLVRTIGTLGEYEVATPMAREVMEDAERTLGEGHRTTMLAMKTYATCLRITGDVEAAEPITTRALALQREHLGPDDVDTLFSLEDLSNIYGAQGRRREAHELQGELLAARRRVHGDDYPLTVRSMCTMALSELTHDRLGEAELLADEAVTHTTEHLEEHHQSLLIARYTRAYIRARRGSFQAADREFDEVLTQYRDHYGPRNLTRLSPMRLLAFSKLFQGQFAGAQRQLEEIKALMPPFVRTTPLGLSIESRLIELLESRGLAHRAYERYQAVAPLIEAAYASRPQHHTLLGFHVVGARVAAGAGDLAAVRALAPIVRSRSAALLSDPNVLSFEFMSAASAMQAIADANIHEDEEDRRADQEVALRLAERGAAGEEACGGSVIWGALDVLSRSQHASGEVDAAIQTRRRHLQLIPAAAEASVSERSAALLAVWEARRALDADPGQPALGAALGDALVRAGRWDEAADAYREARGGSGDASEAELDAARNAALAPLLTRLLQGSAVDTTAERRTRLASMLRTKGLVELAAEQYQLAFAADAALAEDLDAGHRFAAACAAAQAGPELRDQAVEWLGAELGALEERRIADPAFVREALDTWRTSAHLASIRDQPAPSPELRQLWSAADALHERARGDGE